MIEEEIKKIRESEDFAKRRIRNAEVESKEKVERAKKEIRREIEEKRRNVLDEIEKWKKGADLQGKIEAEKIINDYKKRAEEIEGISKERLSEVAREVLNKLIG